MLVILFHLLPAFPVLWLREIKQQHHLLVCGDQTPRCAINVITPPLPHIKELHCKLLATHLAGLGLFDVFDPPNPIFVLLCDWHNKNAAFLWIYIYPYPLTAIERYERSLAKADTVRPDGTCRFALTGQVYKQIAAYYLETFDTDFFNWPCLLIKHFYHLRLIGRYVPVRQIDFV